MGGGGSIPFGQVVAALPSLLLGNLELYSAKKRLCLRKLSQFLYNLYVLIWFHVSLGSGFGCFPYSKYSHECGEKDHVLAMFW